MHAYKVLNAGRSEFTGLVWPLPAGGEPGQWVHAEGPLALCVNGIHASTTEQLPHWLGAEIWEIELDGEVVVADAALVASRARLLRRIDAWDEPTRRRFAQRCLERACAIAERYPAGEGLVDNVRHAMNSAAAAPAGYWTAVLAGESDTGRRAGRDYDEGFLRERTLQAQWLRRELQLAD
jgi:hypothetical protein